MTKDQALKALIEDLRLNHEYCSKEVILSAADELERLSQPFTGLTEGAHQALQDMLKKSQEMVQMSCDLICEVESLREEVNSLQLLVGHG